MRKYAVVILLFSAFLGGCSGDDTFITEIVCEVPPPFCEEDCPDCTDDELGELLDLTFPEPEPSEGFVS